jgi:hypothetical protein
MKLVFNLTTIFALTLITILGVFAQDDSTITDCENRCGTRSWTGQIIGNPQDIAACRDRCVSQYWNKIDGQEKKGKSSFFDD